MNENWNKLIETKKDDKVLEFIKKEFNEKNIIYKIELEERWEGIRVPKYIGIFVVYVKDKYMDRAEEIVSKYYEENDKIEDKSNYSELNINEEKDDTEEESKRISRRQDILGKILIAIVFAMVFSAIIVGTFAK